MIKSMALMDVGDIGIASLIITHDNIKKRFLDIGLIEGCRVECMLSSPSGNPIAYNINGAIIAIRNEDCHCILIQNINKGENHETHK